MVRKLHLIRPSSYLLWQVSLHSRLLQPLRQTAVPACRKYVSVSSMDKVITENEKQNKKKTKNATDCRQTQFGRTSLRRHKRIRRCVPKCVGVRTHCWLAAVYFSLVATGRG